MALPGQRRTQRFFELHDALTDRRLRRAEFTCRSSIRKRKAEF
jgi:hypothetical protein